MKGVRNEPELNRSLFLPFCSSFSRGNTKRFVFPLVFLCHKPINHAEAQTTRNNSHPLTEAERLRFLAGDSGTERFSHTVCLEDSLLRVTVPDLSTVVLLTGRVRCQRV